MLSGNIFAPNVLFTINISGLSVPITDSLVMMWAVMAILIILSLVFVRNFKTVPTGKQNVAEAVVETVGKILKSTMGEHADRYTPYFGTVLLFLLLANMIDLFNIFPTTDQLYALTGAAFLKDVHFGIVCPTKDLNVAGAMAMMSILLVPISGIMYKGIGGFLKSFLKPVPVMLPFHILDYGTRTLSLSLRLFGNMLAGFIITEMLFQGALFVKPLIPLASGFFDIFDAGLQAYIFVFLSSIYIAEAIEH